jgi:hypothetical protein
MNSDRIRRVIQENAKVVSRLHATIHETYRDKARNPAKEIEWREACKEFHSRYDALAFPGGYSGARDRMTAGDSETIETALCFVELRPYFFRSGYMFDALIRKLKTVPLSQQQQIRLQSVLSRLKAWRESKRSANGA